jgi:hypothetical protein
MEVSMILKRAHIELDDDTDKVLCHHYAVDSEEPTVVEINGREYPAVLTVNKIDNTYYIRLDVGK